MPAACICSYASSRLESGSIDDTVLVMISARRVADSFMLSRDARQVPRLAGLHLGGTRGCCAPGGGQCNSCGDRRICGHLAVAWIWLKHRSVKRSLDDLRGELDFS